MKEFIKAFFNKKEEGNSNENQSGKYMPEPRAPIEERFTYNFNENGGKFLYCENQKECDGFFSQIIDENKSYPLLARQRKQEGSPIVSFTILKNGIVEKITIVSSGHRLLDREARRIIMLSSPFPEIPNSMKKDSIDLTVPINFKLNN